MHSRNEAVTRILNAVESLCSGAREVREDRWLRLVRGLHESGCSLDSPNDSILELLATSGGSFSPGDATPSLVQEYHRLSSAERKMALALYSECLESARKDFPRVFHVQVINVPAAAADVLLADRAPANDLPQLSADQKSIAKAFGVSEEQYARGVAAKHFSEDRYRFYAERCWDFVKEVAEIHSIDAIDVIYDVSAERFYCELPRTRFFLDAKLISEPLQRGDKVGLTKAREAIQFATEQALAVRAGSAA